MTGRFTHMRRGFSGRRSGRGRPSARRSRTARWWSGSSTSCEIQAIRKTPVGRLPYGLQKRVELGRALAAEPKLLLLDEPMAGMNVEEKEDMCRFILDVNDEFGTTIALIEHDMGVVMDISDRVVVLDYGRKIGDGTPDEVRGNADGDRRLSRRQPLGDGMPVAVLNLIEVVLNGLMVGVLYSLVALGFVLIFKASRHLQLRAGGDGALRGADAGRAAGGAGAVRAPDQRRSPGARCTRFGWTLPAAVAMALTAAVMVGARGPGRAAAAAPPGEPGADHPLHGDDRARLFPRRARRPDVGRRRQGGRHRAAAGRQPAGSRS